DSATVTIADVSGAENGGPITVTVLLDNAVDGGFDVDVSTADGTATIGDNDYVAVTNQTLSFSGAASETETFTITLGGDDKVEIDETIAISLSNLVPTTIASGNINVSDGAEITISNDDSATVTIADASGNEDDGVIELTVTLDKEVDGGFTVNISTADGTATIGDNDYTAVTNQTLTFSGTVGETETFNVSPTADSVIEPDENLSISMSNAIAATVDVADIDVSDDATVTILDDDSSNVNVTFTATDGAEEGATTVTYTVNLGAINGTGSPITYDILLNNASSAVAADIIQALPTTISVANGTQTQSITFNINNDNLVEGEETLILNLTNASNPIFAANLTASATITDNDSATISLEAIDNVAIEGSNNDAEFRVTLSSANNTGADLNVAFTVTGSATEGTDYSAIGTTVTIGNGGATALIPIENINNDGELESSENVQITLTGSNHPSFTVGSPNTDSIEILDCTIISSNDCDGDGLTNAQENAAGTDPLVADSDGDGINDGQEINTDNTNPLDSCDSNGGTPSETSDCDNDGLTLAQETANSTSPTNPDTDGDGINDGQEVNTDGTDPTDTCDSVGGTPVGPGDCDGDSLSNDLEATLGTDPLNDDTDGDGIKDGVEVGGDISNPLDGDNDNIIDALDSNTADADIDGVVDQLDPENVNPCVPSVSATACGLDTDGDGLLDGVEVALGTNRFEADTDGDGINDDEEVGADFNNPIDTDEDGKIDALESNTTDADNDGTVDQLDPEDADPCIPSSVNCDTDGDGLLDGQEDTLGTDPTKVDTDGDGINDDVEVGADPNNPADTDKDGKIDAIEDNNADSDNDGTNDHLDAEDANPCVPSNTVGICDADADGLINQEEQAIGTDPNKADTDGDGINDDVEVGNDISNPTDSDNDGKIDALESNTADADADGTVDQQDLDDADPCVPNVNAGNCVIDTDVDGIPDDVETSLGTDPNNSDTDGDGIDDGTEVGSDTNNPIDTDGDGIIDAIESNLEDADADGVVDQQDPANNDPCIPVVSATCAIDLSLEKTVDNDTPLVDEEVVFTITVENTATITVNEVVVEDILDATAFEYVSDIADQGSYDSSTGLWTVGALASNTEVSLLLTAKILKDGALRNTTNLKGSSPVDSDATNNSSIAELMAEKNTINNRECGFVFKVFSPNGDGDNDLFIVNCIDRFPSNHLQIVDRFGNVVYEKSNYDNSWDGTANKAAIGGNGNKLAPGTYYYKLDLGDGSPMKLGWIHIVR
ncbi:MAG: gliding motility-associated C-terminal domain-containing protein, partial [Flavobacteriaceae bacterium]|nr:gliding motility-associated C-terminal domain-containing protein [Flavobacteriaceae bacterium]